MCGITSLSKLKCFGLGLANTGSPKAAPFVPLIPGQWDNDSFTKLVTTTAGMCAIATSGFSKCFSRFSSYFSHELQTSTVFTKVDSTLDLTGISSKYFINSNDELLAWGYSVNYEYIFDVKPNAILVKGPSDVAKVVSYGGEKACYLNNSGDVYCQGEYPGNGTSNSDTFVNVDPGVAYTDIAMARSNTCGITSTKQLKCWGDNYPGMLGLGDQTARSSPTLVTTAVEKISLGGYMACAIKTGGDLFCWGNNSVGLGDGTTQSNSPKAIMAGTQFLEVTAGDTACAIRADNSRVMCWGIGVGVGDGNSSNNTTPVLTTDTGAYTKIYSGGTYTTCGVTAGTVKCWGDYGGPYVYNPTTVFTGAIRALTVRQYVSYLVDSNGKFYYLGNAHSAPFGQQYYGRFSPVMSLIDRTAPNSPY
jgi:alpha-tubulin suppressor-like RCC1 family protein